MVSQELRVNEVRLEDQENLDHRVKLESQEGVDHRVHLDLLDLQERGESADHREHAGKMHNLVSLGWNLARVCGRD